MRHTFSATCVAACVYAGAVLATPIVGWCAEAGPAVPSPLDEAVATMRGIRPEEFKGARAKAKGKALNEAWQTLTEAGPTGAARLKKELATLCARNEKDDYFKLAAAALLWQIRKTKEADTVARIWSGGVDLSVNYNYVFYTAYEAARTQDEAVLSMLSALLGDRAGRVFLNQHMMWVPWPLSHEFVWGAFGPKGLPALLRVLRETTDETARASAIHLLAKAHHLPALGAIRRLAAEGADPVRREAVKALGTFGHPEDFAFLVAGLQTDDPDKAWAFAYALYEYEDLRAVPHLVPLLKSGDEALRAEVVACLSHLATPAAVDALHRHAAEAPLEEGRKETGETVAGMLRRAGTSWDDYAAVAEDAQARVLAALREDREGIYRLKPGDRRLTHADLLKAAAEWQEAGRITGGTYEWVEERHVLDAATAEDIPLLLDVEAKVYRRLSDECLYEIRTLDTLIRRLGRRRYREHVGVCDAVRLPDAP